MGSLGHRDLVLSQVFLLASVEPQYLGPCGDSSSEDVLSSGSTYSEPNLKPCLSPVGAEAQPLLVSSHSRGPRQA